MRTGWTGAHEDHSARYRGRHINVGRRQVADPDAIVPRSLTLRGIVESFADLQGLLDAAEPSTQHRLVRALFQQIEVLTAPAGALRAGIVRPWTRRPWPASSTRT